MPRLKRMWTHLSRQKKGVGLRGPGEKQLEEDRRLVEKRINDLRRELHAIERRKEREVAARRDRMTVSLVGYTNAGKSTLMNALTGADVFVAGRAVRHARHAHAPLATAAIRGLALLLFATSTYCSSGPSDSSNGGLTLDNIGKIFTSAAFVSAFEASIQLALSTAIAGAIFGGLLAWAVVRGDPNGLLRQLVIAGSGVLAQFGGVMLAFAFFATFGLQRPRHVVPRERRST